VEFHLWFTSTSLIDGCLNLRIKITPLGPRLFSILLYNNNRVGPWFGSLPLVGKIVENPLFSLVLPIEPGSKVEMGTQSSRIRLKSD
jgi:hypothetical protein